MAFIHQGSLYKGSALLSTGSSVGPAHPSSTASGGLTKVCRCCFAAGLLPPASSAAFSLPTDADSVAPPVKHPECRPLRVCFLWTLSLSNIFRARERSKFSAQYFNCAMSVNEEVLFLLYLIISGMTRYQSIFLFYFGIFNEVYNFSGTNQL